jgi:phosphoribosylamine---glycine ligase
VLHAGTARRDGRIVSTGGRVLSVTATGEDLAAARAAAYQAVGQLTLAGSWYRGDIAERAAAGAAMSPTGRAR